MTRYFDAFVLQTDVKLSEELCMLKCRNACAPSRSQQERINTTKSSEENQRNKTTRQLYRHNKQEYWMRRRRAQWREAEFDRKLKRCSARAEKRWIKKLGNEKTLSRRLRWAPYFAGCFLNLCHYFQVDVEDVLRRCFARSTRQKKAGFSIVGFFSSAHFPRYYNEHFATCCQIFNTSINHIRDSFYFRADCLRGLKHRARCSSNPDKQRV